MTIQWFYIGLFAFSIALALGIGIVVRDWVVISVTSAGMLYLAYQALKLAGAWGNRKPCDGEGE